MKRIIRLIIKKLKRIGAKFKNSICYWYFYHSRLDEKAALFTSKNGGDFAGNMFRILIAIYNMADQNYRIYIAAKKEKKKFIASLLKQYDIKNVKIITYDSVRYFRHLETAKFLFCDSTLPIRYVKRDGQIYVNTWHGTPLKMMGNDSKSDRYNIANVQKNFISADYLVYPSDYCKDKMMGAYSIDSIYGGKVLLCGYPRNDIFYDNKKRSEIIERYDLKGKKVYVYMPTFRESSGVRQDELQINQVKSYMEYLDNNLDDSEILFVKFHVFVENTMEFSSFKHIKKFPQGIETYEFLNAADCLITDYSSVMYDYANTRRKIIRFVYDEKEYYQSRGFYDQPVEMPFPKVYNAEELLDEMHKDKEYDDNEFYDCYCKYDDGKAADSVIKQIMKEHSAESEVNDKYVYIYNESVRPGIITDNLDRILEDNKDINGYLSFSKQSIRKKKENYDNISENVEGVVGISNAYHKTVGEAFAYFLFHNCHMRGRLVQNKLDKLFSREAIRLFRGYIFKKYVFYQGINIDAAEVIGFAGKESSIYLYYNWLDRYDKSIVKRILSHYDEIVVCDEDMKELVKDYLGDSNKKIVVNKFYLD